LGFILKLNLPLREIRKSDLCSVGGCAFPDKPVSKIKKEEEGKEEKDK
jgi:hypothetical protein